MKNQQRYIIFIRLLFLLFLSLSNVCAQSTRVQFKHLTINDGLSHSWVNTITQDKYGFIWIGTDDGLNRYDGNNFRIYKHDRQDTNSIRSSTISKIYEDSRGVLWIGTANGVSIYDRQTDRFIWDPRFSNRRILSLVEDVDGSIWIGSLINIYHLNFKTDSVATYMQNDITAGRTRIAGEYREMIISRRGEIWIGSTTGVHIYDKKKKLFIQVLHDENKPTSLLSNNIRSIVEDHEGRIWIGTDAGLDLIDNFGKNPSDYVFTHYKNNNDPGSITGGVVRTLLEDDKQNLWIGTISGLDLLDLKTLKKGMNSFTHFRNDQNRRTSLNNNSIYSLFQDSQNNIWIGTYGNGINRMSSIPDKFITFVSEPGFKNSLNNNQVNCFFEDGDILWIGTEGGLNRYNRKDDTFKHYVHNPSENKTISLNSVWSICKDRYGYLWIGTWGGGLNRFDYATETFEHYYNDPGDTNSISSNDIFSIIEDRDGYLWIGTLGSGLNMFDRTNKRFVRLTTQNSGIYSNIVTGITETINGDLWLTNYTACVRFDKKKRSFERFLHADSDSTSISSTRIICIFEDRKGTIWIGTDAGLNLLNKTTGKFTYYQKSNGLPDNVINSILEDNNGNLWIGTNNGLSKFINAVNLPEKPEFKNYTYEDGLQGNGFTKRSCLKDKSGILYFGGSNGFNAFDPKKIIENPYIPPIVLTDFEVFNKPVSIGERGLRNDWSADEPLVLSYQQSMFSFNFAVLNYISSKRNQYAYKLEGFDKDWNYIGTKHTATYTNLDPGKYVFRVKGSNNDGVWNEKGVALKLVITPPFWRTWLFYGISVIILISAMISAYRYRIYRVRANERQLARKIEERTKELAFEIAEHKKTADSLQHERNLFRLLIDHLPDAIFVKDTSCRKIFTNVVDIRNLGLTSEAEVLGKDDFEFYPKELAEQYYADDQKIIQTGTPLYNKEEYIVGQKGEKRFLLTSKLPLRDNKGQIIGLVGVGHDITELKRAEEELRLQSAALNAAANAIVITDIEGNFLWINRSFTLLTGYEVEEAIGKNSRDLVKSGKLDKLFYKQLWDTILSGEIWHGEMINRRKDGSLYSEEQTITPLRDTTGKISYFIAIKQDITKRKMLEEEFRQLQKLESLGTLAGGVAHDFNNILGIILAFSSVMERVGRTDPSKFTQSIKAINSAVSRGAALVRQILTFARQTDIAIKPMSVPELAHEVITMLQQTFPKTIEFKEEFDRGVPLISADHTQVHQALLNLCVNARDAMPNGGIITIEIEVYTLEKIIRQFPSATYDRYVCLSVSDTGTGMDETTKERIFDPFFTTKELGKGTGLGLSVVYGVMQSHYGYVSVESEVGKGTTFHLYLPVPQETKKVREEQKKESVALSEGSETILFVEDEELLRTAVQSTLEANGYKVYVAVDGLDAVEIYKEHQNEISLVLSDMGLPKQTGLDVFLALKQIDPNLKMILASGFISLDQKSELLKAGAIDFIQKPYELDEILQKIREVLDETGGKNE